MARLRFLLPRFRRERAALLQIFLLTLGASALAALQPWPLKVLVDQGLRGVEAPAWLDRFLGLLPDASSAAAIVLGAAGAAFGLQALGAWLDARLNWTWNASGRRMVNGLAEDLYRALLARSPARQADEGVGDALGRLSGDTWSIYTAAESLLVAPPQHAIKLAAVGLIAFQLDAQLAVLTLLMAPVLAGTALAFGRPLTQRTRRIREQDTRVLSFVHQTLGVLPMVQAFGAEARQQERFRELARGAVAASQSRVLLKHLFLLVNGLTLSVGASVVLFAGGSRVLEGTLTLGSLLVFLAYFRSIEASSRALLESFTKVKGVGVSIDRIRERMDVEAAVPEKPEARRWRSHGIPPRLDLENVGFAYRPDRPVLRGLDLTILPGQVTAIVGPTGTGKSTLAALLLRWFDPTEGRITLDGIDLRDLELASLRKAIALVPQEPFLLPGTVAENIGYGNPAAGRDAILAAAAAARADAFLRELPEGYDTRLGDRGARLSGGQRQRLAIARALLKDAPVLVLDEPTSALDEETEAGILETLRGERGRRTLLVITHRPALLELADQVVAIASPREVPA